MTRRVTEAWIVQRPNDDDEACERIHYDDDTADEWICPRDKRHRWTHEAYENYVEERKVGA